jgi:hypothetical protein
LVPAGVKKLEVQPHGTSGYQDVGIIRNPKFTAEALVMPNEDHGREFVHNIKLDVDIEAVQTSTEFAYLKETKNLDFKLTFEDGATVEMTDIGAAWEGHLDTDSADVGFIRFIGSGTVQPSAWAALW